MPENTGDKIVANFISAARAISYLDPGGIKSLRNCDEERGCPEYWRICSQLELRGNEVFWAQYLKAIAIITPAGGSPEERFVHNTSAKLGAKLCAQGVSEMRFQRMINADIEARRLNLLTLMMRLGAGTKLDVVQLGFLMLSDNPMHIRAISRQFYDAERKKIKD